MNISKYGYIAMSVKINPILSLIGKNVINCIKKYNDAYIRLYERITH